jgi:RimJ/RimL family protein N-acetyltransferase
MQLEESRVSGASTLSHEADQGDAAASSGIASPRGLSWSIWDLDWSNHLPLTLTDDGLTVEPSTFSDVLPFIVENFASMFEEDPAASPFLKGRTTEAKAQYYRRCADVFAFKDGPDTVGVFVCTPVDWGTYYIRFASFLPAYQGRQLLQRFFPNFFRILKEAGIERVETDTSPSNFAIMHIMNRFRFNATGTMLSERWGGVIRFTKFLDEASEDIFLRQFCTGIRYQARTR